MQDKKEKKEKKNTVLAELKSKEVWLIHENKRPISVLTLKPTGASPDHAKEWTTYEKAEAFLDSCNSENNSNSSDSNKSSGGNGGNGGNGKGDSESTQKLEQAAGQAAEQAEQRGETPLKARGLGFVVPEGYFFVDVDHNDATTDIVKELMKLLPTYAEISPSGDGVHFYGRCDPSLFPQEDNWDSDIPGQKKLSSRYYVKNSKSGLEVYIGGLTHHFSTFTGLGISEAEDAVDCSKELLLFLEQYMKRPQKNEDDKIENGTGTTATGTTWSSTGSSAGNNSNRNSHKADRAGGADGADSAGGDDFDITDNLTDFDNIDDFTTPPDINWGSFDDNFLRIPDDQIDAVIDELRGYANKDKFIALFDHGDYSTYCASQSEADATLCSLIAFRVGPNEELIDKIFRKSALYRDKWERQDYSRSTIKFGIKACEGNFFYGVQKLPPFINVSDKGKESVDSTLFQDYVSNHMNVLVVSDEEQSSSRIYLYRKGVYKYYPDDKFEGSIRKIVEKRNKRLVKSSILQEVTRLIKKSELTLPNEYLNNNENYVNVRNGLLNIKTLELRPHSPKLYSSIQMPVEWGPLQQAGIEEPTPVFDYYMDTLSEGVKDIQKFLLQYMGAVYSNVPGYLFKKSLFLYGKGDTGKSQLKSLVEHMLGRGNFAAIDLDQIEARFGTSHLYGKRLAGASDMKYMKIPQLNKFKSITAGDEIFAERKGQDGFYFTYKGVLWFCMNDLPKFGGDGGKWVYDRIIIIPCNNVIPEEKRDPLLLRKMYAERNGIFYKAIMAIREVLLHGHRFDEPACAEAMREQYKILNSSSIEFFITMMEERKDRLSVNDVANVDTIYNVYREWYKRQGYDPNYIDSQKEFFNFIASYVGVPYDVMKWRTHSATSLKAYTFTEKAMKEYGHLISRDEPLLG